MVEMARDMNKLHYRLKKMYVEWLAIMRQQEAVSRYIKGGGITYAPDPDIHDPDINF